MSTTFRYASGRDMWDRQLGEPAEEYDWFLHWRNEAHRRTYVATALKFGISPVTVTRVAKQNRWPERLLAWKADNSRLLHERFTDLLEQSMVPFAQGMVRMAAHTARAPLDKIPADRAMTAFAAALRVIKEPGIADLIRISAASGMANREIDLAAVILDRLAAQFPEAHDAVLDALDAATQNPAGPLVLDAAPVPAAVPAGAGGAVDGGVDDGDDCVIDPGNG